MVTNKKTTDLVKKIILLLIFVFLSNLYYLYFKKNQKEPFVHNNYNTNVDASAVSFLSHTYSPGSGSGITISAPYNNDNNEINSLTRAVDFALSDKSKNFSSSQGKPKQFPINTIVNKDCLEKGGGDHNAVACMYKPERVAFGYDILPITNASEYPDIRIDKNHNIYLDNYDKIDKIIEREKIDKNYTQKTLDDNANSLTSDGTNVLINNEIYKLRDDNDTNINRRGAVEVAYSRKEELNNTKNKYNIENIRNNSINLQYIFLFCVILASIIVLGLYYISFISNSVLIIYIILVILVIYFFNIINIVN